MFWHLLHSFTQLDILFGATRSPLGEVYIESRSARFYIMGVVGQEICHLQYGIFCPKTPKFNCFLLFVSTISLRVQNLSEVLLCSVQGCFRGLQYNYKNRQFLLSQCHAPSWWYPAKLQFPVECGASIQMMLSETVHLPYPVISFLLSELY